MALDTEYHSELFATNEDGTYVHEREIADQIRDIRALMMKEAGYDPACAPSNEPQEVRMTADEYRGLMDRLNKAELELKAAKADAENAKAALKKEKALNDTLLRSMRDRANVDRGLVPREAEDGYFVLKGRQQKERYEEVVWDTEEHKSRYDSEEYWSYAEKQGYLHIAHKTADVWKFTVQTPYAITMPLKKVRERVEAEEEIYPFLQDIGVKTWLNPEYNGKSDNFGTNVDGEEEIVMYRWKYKPDCYSRLWNMEIFLTGDPYIPIWRTPSQPQKMGKRK